jgi:hypothetical protein
MGLKTALDGTSGGTGDMVFNLKQKKPADLLSPDFMDLRGNPKSKSMMDPRKSMVMVSSN